MVALRCATVWPTNPWEGNMERDVQIISDVLSGRTLAEVGAEHGLTRERIRQIVKQGAPGFNVREARKARTAHRNQQRRAKRRQDIEALRWVADRRSAEKVWTNEEMILCMQEMFAVHGEISIDRWRKVSRGEMVPSSSLYVVRFGSWNAAKQAAGLPTKNQRPLATYHRSHTDEELIDAVVRFLRTANADHGRFGAQHYERWRLENGGPSLASIRSRLGRWSDVKAQAVARNEEANRG